MVVPTGYALPCKPRSQVVCRSTTESEAEKVPKYARACWIAFVNNASLESRCQPTPVFPRTIANMNFNFGEDNGDVRSYSKGKWESAKSHQLDAFIPEPPPLSFHGSFLVHNSPCKYSRFISPVCSFLFNTCHVNSFKKKNAPLFPAPYDSQTRNSKLENQENTKSDCCNPHPISNPRKDVHLLFLQPPSPPKSADIAFTRESGLVRN